MKILTLKACFTTPAFLGNAEQSGQWRTPPFKAQLRQWWRVAYAASADFNVHLTDMRRAEGLLFGHAWLEDDRDAHGVKLAARKSAVRVRLDHWYPGKLLDSEWQPLARVTHGKASVAADLYLGYGPIEKGSKLRKNAAIQAGESAALSLAYPQEHAHMIERALALMDRFGTVGGRSRNGWGSYCLQGADGPVANAELPRRDWVDCLQLDWPHAIGCDEKGALIWQTHPAADWKQVMVRLAQIKIGLRTHFRFTPDKQVDQPEQRHWLSYPVTRPSVQAWGNNARLPNSLRFKVCPTPDGKLIGRIFHMPCLPPKAFGPNPKVIEGVWSQVHRFLGALNDLSRVKG